MPETLKQMKEQYSLLLQNNSEEDASYKLLRQFGTSAMILFMKEKISHSENSSYARKRNAMMLGL